MKLKEIFRPIEKELLEVEKVLENSLRSTGYKSILEMNNYLLNARGKRLRPALFILSAKASPKKGVSKKKLANIASAVELIHMASLIHDDVIDHSSLRHNKPTINSKWGEDVSIALGDYLYSVAFELFSDFAKPDIIRCISSATKMMCEGELIQVCERDNLGLLKERYIIIVKKKTASLFAASCQAGSLASYSKGLLQDALKEYGLNLGVAFQIADDYLDLAGDQECLGKAPGQDIKIGELTLPVLNLLESAEEEERKELRKLLNSKRTRASLKKIKSRLIGSDAAHRTKETALSYVTLAKEKINPLSNSLYKESLLNLADFVMERGFEQ